MPYHMCGILNNNSDIVNFERQVIKKIIICYIIFKKIQILFIRLYLQKYNLYDNNVLPTKLRNFILPASLYTLIALMDFFDSFISCNLQTTTPHISNTKRSHMILLCIPISVHAQIAIIYLFIQILFRLDVNYLFRLTVLQEKLINKTVSQT